MPQPTADEIVRALADERTVDILTVGRRTGLTRATEIWTTLVEGVVYVCGTPAAEPQRVEREPRDWLANLRANPSFTLRLRHPIVAEVPARAVEVTDADERRRLFTAPQSGYYREFSRSVDDFVAHAPVVRVEFADPELTAALAASRANGPVH